MSGRCSSVALPTFAIVTSWAMISWPRSRTASEIGSRYVWRSSATSTFRWCGSSPIGRDVTRRRRGDSCRRGLGLGLAQRGGVVAREGGEGEHDEPHAGQAGEAAGDDREAHAADRGDGPGLDVAEARAARDHEHEHRRHPAAQAVRRDALVDRRAAHRAHAVGRAGGREQRGRDPQRTGEAGERDRHAPHRDGVDRDPPEAPRVRQPAGRQRGDGRAGGDGRVEQAGPLGARVVDAHGEHGEERARHAERHREQVDRERAEQRVVAPHEAQPLGDRAQHRLARSGVHRADGRLGRHRRGRGDHRQARRGLDRVGGADAREPDHHTAQPGPDDIRELRQPEVQRDRRVDELGSDEVGQVCGADEVLDGGDPGEHPAEDVEGGDRRRAEERAEGEAAGGQDERDLVEEQQRAAIVAVGERAAEQRHRNERSELDGAEQAGQERRVRLDVELVGERDERRLRPEPRHDGARHEQPQVARGAQRRDVDGEAREAGEAGQGYALPARWAAARADQGVDLLLLAHDDVLEAVLERLRAALLAGRRDHVLERLDRLRLGVDEPADQRLGVPVGLDRGELDRGRAAERRDLLDEVTRVVELGARERGHLLREAVELEADERARHVGVGDRRALLEAQRDVERVDRLVDLHRILLVLVHARRAIRYGGARARRESGPLRSAQRANVPLGFPTEGPSMADELSTRDAKLIQYLNEAYGKEKELETERQAHIRMTKRPPYKKRLQDHLKETKAQSKGLERRIKALGGKAERAPVTVPGPAAAAAAATKALAAAKGPVHALRGTGEAEKQLKNAKDELWNEYEEIGNYTAIETLAGALNDSETAKLAREFRRQEERMAAFLLKLIPQLTKAVVTEEVPAAGRRKPATASASRGRATRSASASRSSARSSGSARSSAASRA